jgi:acetyl esterase
MMSNLNPSQSNETSFSQPLVQHAIRTFLDALNGSGAPPMETLSPNAVRAVLTEAQLSVKVNLQPADVSTKTITVDGQSIDLKIVRPKNLTGLLSAFMFFHGRGWVVGDFPTNERIIRDLVAVSETVAIYVDYTRSPEAQYPTVFN